MAVIGTFGALTFHRLSKSKRPIVYVAPIVETPEPTSGTAGQPIGGLLLTLTKAA